MLTKQEPMSWRLIFKDRQKSVEKIIFLICRRSVNIVFCNYQFLGDKFSTMVCL